MRALGIREDRSLKEICNSNDTAVTNMAILNKLVVAGGAVGSAMLAFRAARLIVAGLALGFKWVGEEKSSSAAGPKNGSLLS